MIDNQPCYSVFNKRGGIMRINENIGKYRLKSAICKKGHIQISTLDTDESCENHFCPLCGSEVVENCFFCASPIPGGYAKITSKLQNLVTGEKMKRITKYKNTEIPNYCYQCGKPYPWTEKFLKDYRELLELNLESEVELQDKIYNATVEVLQNQSDIKNISVQLLKSYLNKTTRVTKELLLNTLSTICSESLINFLGKI